MIHYVLARGITLLDELSQALLEELMSGRVSVEGLVKQQQTQKMGV